ncbi:hypothetical protein UK23_06135 [Lentzea aerocolonigenes]|uniref:ABC transporter permease n=1 Tax=Lentzea aerocolonigenes TaxID=68170 RepID=A0A0F0H858_LENAE|nr:ABC transporter ATP-binding protein [Lentzea aerocolonigenes]KJK51690.1 hypothetical protein UK23_06135 [Lentzea aerocolonigenes]
MSRPTGSLWPVLVLAARISPRKVAGAAFLLLTGYLATPVVAVLLSVVTRAAVQRDVPAVVWCAVAIAVVVVFELLMGHFAHLLYFEVGESQETVLQERLARITNGTRGVEHLDNARFADVLTLVRRDLPATRGVLEAALQLCGLIAQALITVVLLGFLIPWLALLPLVAVLPVLTSRRADAVLEAAKVAGAADERRARNLLILGTTANAVCEMRLYQAEDEVLRLHRESRAAADRLLERARLRAAVLRAGGQLCFALSYGAAIFLVVRQALAGQADVADLVLVIVLALQVGAQVAAVLGLLTTLQGAGRTLTRIDELEALAQAGSTSEGSGPVPARLRTGITLEGVGFRYPGTDEERLHDVNLTIPAGSTVALIGENGAGKSTLVKLLCGLYRPTSGRILVDGTELSELSAADWAAKVAPLFQDFARLDLLVRENVGVGALPRMHDDEVLREALRSANADAVLQRVPGGLDGLLGRGYGDGAELSGGQWQTVCLARALVRERPLLLVADEPASALDATAEHALFERFAELARAGAQDRGAVTLFVSHRYSTVRTADLIIVLDRGRMAESGTHAQLMNNGGAYAELFRLQARAYL